MATYLAYFQNKETVHTRAAIENVEISPCPSPPVEKDAQRKSANEAETTATDVNDLNESSALQNVVAAYFKVKNPSDISIDQQSEVHAQGEFGQKWWLAFNDDTLGWHIVTTGCSYIECDEIAGYNFPSEMAPKCWNSAQNQLITR